MGNCLRSDKARAWNEEQDAAEQAREVEETKRRRGFTRFDDEEKKMVRFRLTGHQGNAVERESHVGVAAEANKVGVARIKVVVTRQELQQILKQSSAEKLVTAMKLRGRTYEVRRNDDGSSYGSWRPALESIPEDH